MDQIFYIFSVYKLQKPSLLFMHVRLMCFDGKHINNLSSIDNTQPVNSLLKCIKFKMKIIKPVIKAFKIIEKEIIVDSLTKVLFFCSFFLYFLLFQCMFSYWLFVLTFFCLSVLQKYFHLSQYPNSFFWIKEKYRVSNKLHPFSAFLLYK